MDRNSSIKSFRRSLSQNGKKSLVKPERSRITETHPNYHYAKATIDNNVDVMPSSSGHDPLLDIAQTHKTAVKNDQGNNNEHNNKQYYLPNSIPVTEKPLLSSSSRFSDKNISNTNREIPNSDPSTSYIHIKDTNSSGLPNAQPDGNSRELQFIETYDTYNTVVDNINRSSKSTSVRLSNPNHKSEIIPDDNNMTTRNSIATSGKKYNSYRDSGISRKKLNKTPLPGPWSLYCSLITIFIPSSLLALCGMRMKNQQQAWREKIGLISFIFAIAAIVGFLTFGFTQAVCDESIARIQNSSVDNKFLIVNGRAYDLTRFTHPGANGIPENSNILYPPVNAGGLDASFLFQNVNHNCKGLINPRPNSTIPKDDEGNVAWYFPCKLYNPNGATAPNKTWDYYSGYACHTTLKGRESFYSLKASADIYFTWKDITNLSRSLIVYSGNVLDLSLLDWLDTSSLTYPAKFDELRNNGLLHGLDITWSMTSSYEKQIGKCLIEIIRVGSIDSDTVGCITSKVVLYISLVFIVGIVLVKFLIACFFAWYSSVRRLKSVMKNQLADYSTMRKRNEEIEKWSNDINKEAPAANVFSNNTQMLKFKKHASKIIPKSSRFSHACGPTIPYQVPLQIPKFNFSSNNESFSSLSTSEKHLSPHITPSQLAPIINENKKNSIIIQNNRLKTNKPLNNVNNSSLDFNNSHHNNERTISPYNHSLVLTSQHSLLNTDYFSSSSDFQGKIHPDVIFQPPVEYQPFNFSLAHTICLVTAYSESFDGLRTTLDSIATSDYPNSHKLIFIVADGQIKGEGNNLLTPAICLSMMKDFLILPEKVKSYSYVAVASGSKRQNMAKVHSGFYKYDDQKIPQDKQQQVPVILVEKCGTPEEANNSKPGNRGKRDSQIILMSFFQHVMFNERMTELDFEIYSAIWGITGISPSNYEICLMVDADTKIFTDALTIMVGTMVRDPDVMGLCGETKIANKNDSYITRIQVFEYFISHHQTKAFESMFGGVTCLPGCFCMYRIKAPKGPPGYWVPILANPDIIERYSDNVTDSLHKKNLLLLGEDRYLSTLMLRTFPKRKQIFVPQAVCKTVVPDTLKILMSQRRRWINSTVHNLMELLLVNDLCGVFCFSMQFVVFIELVGTLILPAALSFTIYVVIISIVRKPIPVIPLVLLALILGLPGVLIIITAHRWSYIIWMLIYLTSLPIWNLLLPLNAYWKFDDFSWGNTHAIAGGAENENEESEGVFDHSQIRMLKWKEFDEERREKNSDPY